MGKNKNKKATVNFIPQILFGQYSGFQLIVESNFAIALVLHCYPL